MSGRQAAFDEVGIGAASSRRRVGGRRRRARIPGDCGHDFEFGVFVEPTAQCADQVVALSALAEEAGYDLVTFAVLLRRTVNQAVGRPRCATEPDRDVASLS
jgi:hypothetical protein